MPISTSPYQQNDYTALSARQPYKLPTQQIAQAAMALDQFWKQGAARVKAAYDSVLNLNLTSDENIDVKNKFLEDSQKQLTKLSSMDLSDPSVQRQGLSIFKPIFKDKAIVQDDYLTNLKQKIFSDADEYKRDTKTKGAGFHMDNLAYALEGFQGFNSKTARNQIGDIFETAKDSQYIPYYDDSKERLAILQACKADKLSNTTNQGPYLDTFSNNSLSQSKLYGCLEGGLSDQSRQQTRISAAVRYGHDYEAVRNDYIGDANDRKDYYETQKLKYAAQKAALSDTPENQDKILELKGQIDSLDKNIEKLNGDINTYSSWDTKFMKDNYETLASNAFFRRKNGSFAQAFAYQDITDAKKADPIYITEYVQNELNKRQFAGFQNDIFLENLKLQNKLKLGTDGEGKNIDNLTRFKLCAQTPGCNLSEFLTEAYKEEPTTSGKIEGQINTLNGQKFDLIKDLKNDPDVRKLIGDIDPGDATNFNEEGYKKMWGVLNEYIKTADNADPNKQRFISATNKLLEIENRKTILGGILEDAQNEVSKNNPQLKVDFDKESNKIFSYLKPQQTTSGTVLGVDRLRNIIEGGDTEYTLRLEEPSSYESAQSQGKARGSYSIVNKKTGNIEIPFFNSSIVNAYNDLTTSNTGNYKSAIDKYLGESTAVQKMGIATGDLFTKGSPAERDVQSLFGNYLAEEGRTDIKFSSVGGLDPETGKVKIQATDSKGRPISASDLMDALAKNKVATSVYSKVDNQTLEVTLPTVVKTLSEVPELKAPLYSDVLRLQLNYLDKKVASLPSNGIILQVGRSMGGNSYAIKVKKGWGTKQAEYTIVASGKNGTQEIPISNQSGIDTKENALISIDKYLNGINNLNKQ